MIENVEGVLKYIGRHYHLSGQPRHFGCRLLRPIRDRALTSTFTSRTYEHTSFDSTKYIKMGIGPFFEKLIWSSDTPPWFGMIQSQNGILVLAVQRWVCVQTYQKWLTRGSFSPNIPSCRLDNGGALTRGRWGRDLVPWFCTRALSVRKFSTLGPYSSISGPVLHHPAEAPKYIISFFSYHTSSFILSLQHTLSRKFVSHNTLSLGDGISTYPDVDEVLHAHGGGNARLHGRSVGEVILNAKTTCPSRIRLPPQSTNYQGRSMKHLADDARNDTSCIIRPDLTVDPSLVSFSWWMHLPRDTMHHCHRRSFSAPGPVSLFTLSCSLWLSAWLTDCSTTNCLISSESFKNPETWPRVINTHGGAILARTNERDSTWMFSGD